MPQEPEHPVQVQDLVLVGDTVAAVLAAAAALVGKGVEEWPGLDCWMEQSLYAVRGNRKPGGLPTWSDLKLFLENALRKGLEILNEEEPT